MRRDEATREMEMELSRERAEMARERIRLDRLRDEDLFASAKQCVCGRFL